MIRIPIEKLTVNLTFILLVLLHKIAVTQASNKSDGSIME